MEVSVVIPAHNEEAYIGQCLHSIEVASRQARTDIEVIVVANRCSDRTEEIAYKYKARVIHDDSRNLSHIRNTGLHAASAKILVTIDADSLMSENALTEVIAALNSAKYIGGGTIIKFSRYSAGLLLTDIVKNMVCFVTGLSGGMFWFRKESFEAIGGFNERVFVAEDFDFAVRLKKLGKFRQKKFIVLPRAHIITSARKFDTFGDWTFFKLLLQQSKIRKSIRGEDEEFSSKYFYDFNG